MVKECNNEAFVFITERSYVTRSRYRRAHTAVCSVRSLSYKNKRLVTAFLDHLVLGAVEQLYYRQFTRPSLLREGLACETIRPSVAFPSRPHPSNYAHALSAYFSYRPSFPALSLCSQPGKSLSHDTSHTFRTSQRIDESCIKAVKLRPPQTADSPLPRMRGRFWEVKPTCRSSNRVKVHKCASLVAVF